ncbi:MAG: DUF3592 domain-containing protein [Acetatifactor sp.]|nr:DUF3592 domain-containing protein [Acetatifactor sp.]
MKKNINEKVLLFVPTVFLIAGVCMFIWGFCWLISTFQFKATAVKVPGEITRMDSAYDDDGDEHYSVFVSYEYNGKKYEDIRINSYSSSMYMGKKMSLYCDPENPGHVEVGSMLFFPSVFLLIMGAAFALIGGGVTIRTMVVSFQRKRINEQGISIYATVEEIVYDTSVAVNGRHPYTIICTYRDDYKDITYRFKSENLWFDPSPVLPVESTIEVKVDANDYSKYYVNVEEATKRIVDYT